MNFFIDFWTEEIFSSFKSSHSCVDFHTCNSDISSIRNWKFLKIWRLNRIGSSFKVNLFIISLLIMLSLVADSALTVESAAFFIFVFSSLSVSFALSISNSITTPLLMSDSVSILLSISNLITASLSMLNPVSMLLSTSELLSISLTKLDSNFSTSKNYINFLLISVYY